MGNRILPEIPVADPRVRKGIVLAVDDDIGPRESLRMLLKNEYFVVTADGAATALEMLGHYKPEVIILDIMMSPRDGIDCLAEIRSIDQDVSVVMLTGHAGIKTAQAAIRLGASDYLQKPFDKDEMLSVVDRHVRRTRAHRQRREVEHRLQELHSSMEAESNDQLNLSRLGMAAATLLHDIRNPLTVAINFLDLLGRDLRSLPATGQEVSGLVRQDMDSIELALTRCRELTDTWNTMLRPPSKTAEKVQLDQLVQQVVQDLRLLPEVSSTRITADGPACEVICHPVLLQRALANLVLNAVHACVPGEGTVQLKWIFLGGMVHLMVIDNGCGIAKEQLANLGQPFYSTKSKGQGTGLGLLMAIQTMRLYGGNLRVESEVGRGTTIHLELLTHNQANTNRLRLE
jgi:signal transduction histidine kinase